MNFLNGLRFSAVVLATLAVFNGAAANHQSLQCSYTLPDITRSWIQMADPCIKGIKRLISLEMENSIQYLALAAHYYRDDVNRPAFGDMFVESSHGKRAHAIDLIDYLNMRGQNEQGHLFQIQPYYPPVKHTWNSLTEGLEFVLNLEARTTNAYLETIAICEKGCNFDDYHFVNWASANFLPDMYNDEKWYADKASSLKKLIAQHKNLGEFMSNFNLQDEHADFDWQWDDEE